MFSSTCRQAIIRRAAPFYARQQLSFRRLATTQAQADNVGDHNAYCRDLVRKRDYDAFLTSQLYPATYKNSFYALRAFFVSVCSAGRDMGDNNLSTSAGRIGNAPGVDIQRDDRPDAHAVLAGRSQNVN